VIADCLENQFISHDLRDENHARQLETTVQDLLSSVGDAALEKLRSCDIQKLADTETEKTCALDRIPNEYLGIFQEDYW
jgi:hypothetical protein